MVGHCTCDGDPALISEGSDDQSGGGSQVLIAIVHSGSDLPHQAQVAFFNVVLQLLLPCEVINGLRLHIDEIGDDITIVDISSDQCHCNFVIEGFEIGPDEFSELCELLDEEVVPAS